MSSNSDDLDKLSNALQSETSFKKISCANTCSICGKPSVAYLHPLEDGTECVACEGCAGNLVAEGTHREYPFESASQESVEKRIVNKRENLLIVQVDADDLPVEETWVKICRESVVVVAKKR